MNPKLLFAAAFVSLALTAVASAADLPARTTYTKAPDYVSMSCAWCGWYIGANGGGTWGGRTGSLTNISPAFAAFEISELVGSALGSNHGGGFGGGQFGYNWVMSNWLVGFEADIQGADIGRAGTVSAFIPDDREVTGVSTGRDHIDWFGTARGRLGFTTGNVLFYGTGGLAFGGVHSSASRRRARSSVATKPIFSRVARARRDLAGRPAPVSNGCSRRTGASRLNISMSISAVRA